MIAAELMDEQRTLRAMLHIGDEPAHLDIKPGPRPDGEWRLFACPLWQGTEEIETAGADV